MEPTPEMMELIEKEKRGEITMEGYKDMLIYPPSALVEEDEDDYE